jgi:hypothetical protein
LAADAYADTSGAGILAFMPALGAGLAMMLFAVAAVRHGDELQRLVHLEALAFAFVGLAVVCLVLAILPTPAGGELPEGIRWIHLWILLSTLWCVGLGAAHWRHR